MKTIDEMRAEIKATHERQMEELRALDAELDAIKAKMESERQWPKKGDEYYFLSIYGYVMKQPWEDDAEDKTLASIGNCFRTKAEAEKHRDWLKAVAEIRRMIGDRVGRFKPALDVAGRPSFNELYRPNPFGCETAEFARQVASSPAFKTFLGVD